MSIQVVNRLRTEHQNIQGLLRILRRQLDSIGRGDKPDFYLMHDIIHYLTYYPDRYHHPYEDLMFGRLVARRPDLARQADEVGKQHRLIAREGNNLRSLVGSIIDGTVVSRDELLQAGVRYVDSYDRHMQAEEEQLFAALPGALKPADWMVLVSAYHWQPDPVFSEEVSREYRHLRNCITEAGAGSWPWRDVVTHSCLACSSA